MMSRTLDFIQFCRLETPERDDQSMERITKVQARQMALAAGLAASGRGKQASLRAIEHLGYVQIDTISVIERAHHHVLWTRHPGYRPEHLNELLSVDRTVFEHWAHAVAYLPMKDYRFYLANFEAFRKPPTSKWGREGYAAAKPWFKKVLKRVEVEGPLSSRDFQDLKGKKHSGWWDWKPAKLALEYLYRQGDLMVSERRNFQRYFDLTERVLPSGVDLTEPTAEERAEHQIRRALRSMGLAREAEIAKYLALCPRTEIRAGLRRLLAEGAILELSIKALEGEIYYSDAGTLKASKGLKSSDSLRILSPFDNVTIQRERMRLLFDFDYTIECYVPERKRRYGYFVCPVLWKNQLVARIDMKADRKNGKLLVKSIHYEPDFKKSATFTRAFKSSLEGFAQFNGCSGLDGIEPTAI